MGGVRSKGREVVAVATMVVAVVVVVVELMRLGRVLAQVGRGVAVLLGPLLRISVRS